MNAGEGDKNDLFCFFKQDERKQDQPQQNNMPDKKHNNTNRGEERRGDHIKKVMDCESAKTIIQVIEHLCIGWN